MVTIIITETLIAFIIIFISVINFVIIIGQFIISCTGLSFKPAEGYMISWLWEGWDLRFYWDSWYN